MEKPTENANFQSKLEELANFAESILQGTNESYKKELWNKVGLLFIKGFDSHLPSSKMGVTNKKAKKELMDLPDEIWIRILGFLKKTDVFKSFALTCKHFNRLSLDPSIIKSLTLEKMDYLDHEHLSKYKEPNVRPDVRNFSKRLLMTFSHADGPPIVPRWPPDGPLMAPLQLPI